MGGGRMGFGRGNGRATYVECRPSGPHKITIGFTALTGRATLMSAHPGLRMEPG